MTRQLIPHSRPSLGREEERAVLRVLRSGMVGGGEEVERFEAELAARVGVRGAVAVHSGSAALHLALLGLGVKPGDRVLVPSYACAAVLNAVRQAGAREILADVDPATCNLTAALVRRRLRARTAAVVVPHLLGRAAPVAEIRRLGVPVVEDCAMSLGGETGRAGDAAVFSFYATKMAATGHGGALASGDRRLVERVRDLVAYDNRDDYRPRFNARMSGLAAALGRAQLRRLPDFVKRRRRIAEYYYRTAGLGEAPPGHVFYRFTVRARSVERFVRYLAARGVEGKRPVYRPLHTYFPAASGEFSGADELHRTVVSVPCYPALRPGEVERVARALREGAALLG